MARLRNGRQQQQQQRLKPFHNNYLKMEISVNIRNKCNG